jgi:hypothetical protein
MVISGSGSALLRFFVELLRLLLQLGKATLGIDVDGILCDLALHMLLLAQTSPVRSRKEAHGSRCLRTALSRGTYNVELLLERLWRL